MRALLLFLLLFCANLFAVGTFVVDDLKEKNLAPYTLCKLAPFDTPLGTILEQKQTFVPCETLPKQANIGEIWMMFNICNPASTSQEIVLKTVFTNIAYMDIYAYEGARAVEHIQKGTAHTYSFPQSANAATLTIAADTSLNVIVKIKALTLPNLDLVAMSPRVYLKKLTREVLIYVFMMGLIVSLALLSAMIYKHLKCKEYLYYALYIVSMGLMIGLRNGYEVWVNPGLEVPMLYLMIRVFAVAAVIFMLLFVKEFLNLRKTLKLADKLLNVKIIATLLIAMHILSLFTPTVYKVYFLFFILLMVSVLVVAAISAYKRTSGAAYFLFAHGMLLSTAIYQIVNRVFDKALPSDAIIVPLLGFTSDVFFIALALGVKFKAIRAEMDEKNKLIELSAKETAVARTVHNITHQWKAPLAQAGALTTRLELSIDSDTTDKEDKIHSIRKVNTLLQYMSELTLLYQNIYKINHKAESINVAELVQKVLLLLEHKLKESHAEIKQDESLQSMQINTVPNIFIQVLIILLDNALNIFEQRAIEKPTITISIAQTAQQSILSLSDNAGGIDVHPVEKIFEQHYSTNNEGMGYGLYLAKLLTEKYLNGNLSAENRSGGACFYFAIQH